ncbi:hypothetical protein [Leisingera sp. F5]|uniref:hypothetical protein n=1 Tax=Leisingera sp. F5 TaxID=1813816 RepID=UPI0025BFB0C6|nr:hypothetical protein [Leisingera sp. F5]
MYLVDAHVHLHACFDPPEFLDAASGNFSRLCHGLDLPASTPGVLLFTQSRGADAFGGLRPGHLRGWTIDETAEPVSLRASKDGQTLALIAGRQIVTGEGLEVLAYGAAGPFPDGEPIERAIERVLDAGGAPALPWGFGKWSGARGRVIRRIANDHARFPFLFFGDNAGRPALWSRPRLFGEVEQLRRAILPGTDPLPFRGELHKVGRLAFVANDGLSLTHPFQSFRTWHSTSF